MVKKYRSSNFQNSRNIKRFQKSIKAKVLKLERFAWSHWIRKYLFHSSYQFHPRSRPGPEMAQLPQTSPRKKWKTLFLSEDQKVELVIRLFSDYLFGNGSYTNSFYQVCNWQKKLLSAFLFRVQ